MYDSDPYVYISLITPVDLDLSEDQSPLPFSEPPAILPQPVVQETTPVFPLHVDIVPLQYHQSFTIYVPHPPAML